MEIRPDVHLHQIQGNITPGFRKDFQELLFVRFPDAASGRAWLRALYPAITSAWEVATFNRLYRALRHPPRLPAARNGWAPPPRADRDVARFARSTWLNVALTARGIERLGGDLTGFPEAFVEGLFRRTSNANRAFVLGKKSGWTIRDSLREGEAEDDGAPTLTHAVLLVGADSQLDLVVELRRQYRRLAIHGVDLVTDQRGETLGEAREHFGFRDALSQPDPADPLVGWTTRDPARDQEQLVAPGEFILGCPNETEQPPTEHEAARNGSYLAFLRLVQDVPRFRSTMAREAASLTARGVPMTPELLAAKVVGRWPSGAKVTAEDGTDPFPGGKADAEQSQIWTQELTDDQLGNGCPLFSHVRKVHPRGEQVNGRPVATRQHRIIRRGIPFGPPLPPGATDTAERGLLFLTYQADLERQFEHLLRAWANEDSFPDRDHDVGWDALIGFRRPRHERIDDQYGVLYQRPDEQPGVQSPDTVVVLDRYVWATGGGYFFAPSIAGVAALAEGQFSP